jgi:putative sigma-54 modulation protein
MDIQITARHFNASEALQERVHSQISKLERFYPNITDAVVVLDAEKEHLRKVEVKMNILDKTIAAKGEEENMGKALDSVLKKLERQLKRENEKLKDHKSQPIVELVD